MRSDPVQVPRRSFLGGLSLSLGGLALGFYPGDALGDEPKTNAASQQVEDSASGLNPSVFVHIAEDGATTIVCHRSEMGQGVRSSIPVLIADELGADMARVVVQQADGDKKYGDQNTDGSSSIRKGYDDLRRVGATAREMLIAAAARRWKVKPDTCEARDHRVTHTPTGRSFGFGELVREASKIPVPKEARTRPRSELTRVNSASLPLLDGRAIVTGKAVFGADVHLPGTLIAVIARPPVVGGKVTSVDATRALAIPGVKRVVRMPAPARPYKFQPWGGVAVVADTTWAAMRGRAALEIQWDPGDNASYDSTAFREELLQAVRAPGAVRRNTGDAESVLARTPRVVETEYTVPHLAQMPMEPPVAIASFAGGKCEVWAPTQNPQAARTEVARVLGIDEDHVAIHVTLLGGAFGRKSKADFVSEAAFLSREAGAPVRVQWTREDDVQHGYYNTVNAQRIRAALDDRGKVLLEIIGRPRVLSLTDLGIEKLANYGEPLAKYPVDAGRLRSVVERVTAASRWAARKTEGRALGLAVHRSFVAYTAVVLSVVRDDRRKVRVDEAWISMDSGTVVNQDRVRAQMEGAVVMGISNAMFGGITMKQGVTEQSNFRDARIARIGDAPRTIHIDLVPSDAPPCGVGEPGVPPVGPALANAVFALTGQRIRALPLARALGA